MSTQVDLFTNVEPTSVSPAFAKPLVMGSSGSSRYDVMYKFENSLPLSSSEQAKLTSISPEEWAGYDDSFELQDRIKLTENKIFA